MKLLCAYTWKKRCLIEKKKKKKKEKKKKGVLSNWKDKKQNICVEKNLVSIVKLGLPY